MEEQREPPVTKHSRRWKATVAARTVTTLYEYVIDGVDVEMTLVPEEDDRSCARW